MDEEIQRLEGLLSGLQQRIGVLEARPALVDHYHTGFDVSKVRQQDIAMQKLHIWHTIQGTNAATAAFYSVFFIATAPCYLSSFKEVHETAGTAGGTVSLTLEKLTGTQAPDAGSVMLNAALSLKATANTVQTGVLTQTTANLNLAVGDRLCMKDSGTLTTVANVTVDVEITFS